MAESGDTDCPVKPESTPGRSELAIQQIAIAKQKIKNQMKIGKQREGDKLRKRASKTDDNPARSKKSKMTRDESKKDEKTTPTKKPKPAAGTGHRKKSVQFGGKHFLIWDIPRVRMAKVHTFLGKMFTLQMFTLESRKGLGGRCLIMESNNFVRNVCHFQSNLLFNISRPAC